jgi:hypothetical protein
MFFVGLTMRLLLENEYLRSFSIAEEQAVKEHKNVSFLPLRLG